MIRAARRSLTPKLWSGIKRTGASGKTEFGFDGLCRIGASTGHIMAIHCGAEGFQTAIASIWFSDVSTNGDPDDSTSGRKISQHVTITADTTVTINRL